MSRRGAAIPLAVLAGGMVGTALRLGADAAVPHPPDAWPWSTLAVNVLGALVLGVLVARVWATAPAWLRAGLGAGVLGSYTTFSALTVSAVAMSASGSPLLAVLYVGVSLLAGLAAAWAGLATGRPRTRIGADE